MHISLTLSTASSIGIIGVAVVALLRTAIREDGAWWRLVAILAALAVIGMGCLAFLTFLHPELANLARLAPLRSRPVAAWTAGEAG